ncbi:hypothetical protein EGW08_017846 [Elysia chlorotica]|uniref:Uncharacterized protein n=1 Tax=Elysia chlorotica TaxID=188477 RepID=A0A3S1B869_ELYCH|nr:hypothetical protein EGW08_017846 [Elysia chlorotica]
MLLFSTAICRLTFVVQSLWTIGLVWGDEMSYTDQESESTGSWGMKINDTIDKEVSTADVLQIRGGNTTYENVLRGYGLKLKQSDFDGMSGERLGPSHRSNRSHKSFSQGSDRTHTEVLGNSTRSPYEISPRFHGRKLLAKSESSPDLDSAAKEIAANPIQTDPIAKKINEKNEQIKKEKEAGPEIYIDKWPALRHKMADLKKKILAARKKLDDPVNKLLERIDEGDELQKQASHISNLQRLDHLGKASNSKTIKALKDSYKDLYSAISNITGAFEKMEDSLTDSSVNVGVQKLEHELRTLMQFETAQVETAIDSGWSAITNSLAGTTNFQYSVLKDTPKAPVFSIYRYGDGHGEKTNLREELKNMQTSIDSLSYESQDATDPDLQRVDQVLRDMLGKVAPHERNRIGEQHR